MQRVSLIIKSCLADSFQINIILGQHSKLSLDLICRTGQALYRQKSSTDYVQTPTHPRVTHMPLPKRRKIRPKEYEHLENPELNKGKALPIYPALYGPSAITGSDVALKLPADIRLACAGMICVPFLCIAIPSRSGCYEKAYACPLTRISQVTRLSKPQWDATMFVRNFPIL